MAVGFDVACGVVDGFGDVGGFGEGEALIEAGGGPESTEWVSWNERID